MGVQQLSLNSSQSPTISAQNSKSSNQLTASSGSAFQTNPNNNSNNNNFSGNAAPIQTQQSQNSTASFDINRPPAPQNSNNSTNNPFQGQNFAAAFYVNNLQQLQQMSPHQAIHYQQQPYVGVNAPVAGLTLNQLSNSAAIMQQPCSNPFGAELYNTNQGSFTAQPAGINISDEEDELQSGADFTNHNDLSKQNSQLSAVVKSEPLDPNQEQSKKEENHNNKNDENDEGNETSEKEGVKAAKQPKKSDEMISGTVTPVQNNTGTITIPSQNHPQNFNTQLYAQMGAINNI